MVVMQGRSLFRRWTGKLLMAVLALSLVAGTTTGVLWWRNTASDQPEVAFTIEGTKYTQDDIRTLIKYPVSVGVSEKDAAEQAYDMYKLEVAARKLDLSLNDSDLEKTRVLLFPDSKSMNEFNEWQKLTVRNQAFNAKMAGTNTQYPELSAKGYVYVFYFGNLIQTSSDYALANTGNETLIAQDKEYAKSQADKYYAMLKNGEISPEQAYKEITVDTRLGYHNQAGATLSRKVGGTATPFSAIPFEDMKLAAYDAAGKAGLNAVQVGRDYATETSKNRVNTYYYIIYITKAGNSECWEKLQQSADKLRVEYRGLE
jgi:hypothetical protein